MPDEENPASDSDEIEMPPWLDHALGVAVGLLFLSILGAATAVFVAATVLLFRVVR
jgi:hypothetical protein